MTPSNVTWRMTWLAHPKGHDKACVSRNKVQPIPLGVTFSNAVSKLKAQSSNVSFHWNVAKETFELWALSFWKCHPKWDWLYVSRETKVCVEIDTYLLVLLLVCDLRRHFLCVTLVAIFFGGKKWRFSCVTWVAVEWAESRLKSLTNESPKWLRKSYMNESCPVTDERFVSSVISCTALLLSLSCVSQCGAVCCSVLQCVVQCVAVCCSVSCSVSCSVVQVTAWMSLGVTRCSHFLLRLCDSFICGMTRSYV